MMIVLFVIFYTSCVHISLSGSKGPEVTEIGTAGGDGRDMRMTCVHGVLMICSGALLKGVPKFPVDSLEAPLQWASWTRDVVQVPLRARMTIYGTHGYDCLVLGCFILFM